MTSSKGQHKGENVYTLNESRNGKSHTMRESGTTKHPISPLIHCSSDRKKTHPPNCHHPKTTDGSSHHVLCSNDTESNGSLHSITKQSNNETGTRGGSGLFKRTVKRIMADRMMSSSSLRHQASHDNVRRVDNPTMASFQAINPSFCRYLAEKHHISLTPELLAQLHSIMKSSPEVLHGSHPERILPQVFGPVCITGRDHRKKMLALEFLSKMLPQILKDAGNTEVSAQDMLNCRYLRLTDSNIETLEHMCLDAGAPMGIHHHSKVDDVAAIVFGKSSDNDIVSNNVSVHKL
ncbi:uncharacterized protein LOC102808756 [Saccoglossus kowalevskii]